jgi:hypothetical protein
MSRDDRDDVAREMLGAEGPRRWADPHSVIAADLLRARLRRLEGIGRAINSYRAGRRPAMARQAAGGEERVPAPSTEVNR